MEHQGMEASYEGGVAILRKRHLITTLKTQLR